MSKLPTLKKEFRTLKRTGSDTTKDEVAKKVLRFNADENKPRLPPRKGTLRRSISMTNLNANPKKIIPDFSQIRKKTVATKPTPQTQLGPSASGPPKSKKRAAWDYKGRLQDLEEIVGKLNSEKNVLREKHEATDTERQQLLLTVQDVKSINDEREKIITDLRKGLRESESQVESLKYEVETLRYQKDQTEIELKEKREKSIKLECENLSLRTSLNELQELHQKQTQECTSLRAENSRMKETICNQNEQLITAETTRRELHNLVQDLKGNIRVFCRVRPLTAQERALENGCVSFPDLDQKVIKINSTRRDSVMDDNISSSSSLRTQTHEFSFDRVFDPETSQASVFDEISQLVQSALDGYNVCVFAYGPTGSGKTFTMEGICDDYDDAKIGMIPRAVDQIFKSIEKLKSTGWEYTLSASFIEIYNEKIRDLLNLSSTQNHEIKFTKHKEPYVTNITHVTVTDTEHVLDLIKNANRNRAVAATKCNEHSSRSHSVFSLSLNGLNASLGETTKATLNLIDLAGSERVKLSGSEGDRLTEAKNINKSLSTLGNVIMAIANKADHIPYRNSKLTLLLSSCLSGNSKTLMFINISPSEENNQETLNSLRFAKKVNECYIGAAQKRR